MIYKTKKNKLFTLFIVIILIITYIIDIHAQSMDPTILDPMEYHERYKIKDRGLDRDYIKYQKEKNRPYGELAITFLFLTLAGTGVGIYFDVRIMQINDRLGDMYDRYKSATDWTTATKLHRDIENYQKKNDTEKLSMYRWIAYGGAGAFGITALGLLIKYVTVVNLQKKIMPDLKSQGSVSFDFNIMKPEYTAEAFTGYSNLNIMIYSASVSYRF